MENGKETNGRTMIAFGGRPLHAARMAQKLGMDRVLIPGGAGGGLRPWLPRRADRDEVVRPRG